MVDGKTQDSLDKVSEKLNSPEREAEGVRQQAVKSSEDLLQRQREAKQDQENPDRPPKSTSMRFGRIEITGDDGKPLVKGMQPAGGDHIPFQTGKGGTDTGTSRRDGITDYPKNDPEGRTRSEVEKDGTRITSYKNGDQITEWPKDSHPARNGIKRTIERKDGSETDEHSDGSRSTVNKKTGEKIFEYPKDHPKGGNIEKEITRPDGTEYKKIKGGIEVTENPNNDPKSMVSLPDGTDTYTFKDGSKVVVDKDGNQTKYRDGQPPQSLGKANKAELRVGYGIGADHEQGIPEKFRRPGYEH